jgi:thiol-disulfide isomerase/thioredoxin
VLLKKAMPLMRLKPQACVQKSMNSIEVKEPIMREKPGSKAGRVAGGNRKASTSASKARSRSSRAGKNPWPQLVVPISVGVILLVVGIAVWHSLTRPAPYLSQNPDSTARATGTVPVDGTSIHISDSPATTVQNPIAASVAQPKPSSAIDGSTKPEPAVATDLKSLPVLGNSDAMTPDQGLTSNSNISSVNASGLGNNPPNPTGVHREGAGFSFTFSEPDVFGKMLDLQSLRGKVVIVDLWGTWCPPCRKEIPHFVKLKNKYTRKGLEIVGVNFERVSDDDAVKLVKKARVELKINYRCVIGTDAIQNQIPDLEGFPTTLLLNRAGKVHQMLVGYHSYEELEEIVKPLLDDASANQ